MQIFFIDIHSVHWQLNSILPSEAIGGISLRINPKFTALNAKYIPTQHMILETSLCAHPTVYLRTIHLLRHTLPQFRQLCLIQQIQIQNVYLPEQRRHRLVTFNANLSNLLCIKIKLYCNLFQHRAMQMLTLVTIGWEGMQDWRYRLKINPLMPRAR